MHVTVLAPPATATIGVAGSTGYAGRELLRLLAGHPRLRGVACTADTRALAQCDLALLALPHGVSGEVGRELAGARVPVVDLSADLRGEWQYGLPELHRGGIAGERQVANPGCYATAAILALAPLVAAALVEPRPGGGRQVGRLRRRQDAGRGDQLLHRLRRASRPTRRSATTTRPRSRTQLLQLGAGPVSVTFTPHLAPFSRGLLVTAYARLRGGPAGRGRGGAVRERYEDEPFVALADGVRTQALRGSNPCHIQALGRPAAGR